MRLAAPIAIAGPVKMKLTVATTAPDMHWMVKLVDGALRREPHRVPTRPTRGSQERRLEEKHRQAKRKQDRRTAFDD